MKSFLNLLIASIFVFAIGQRSMASGLENGINSNIETKAQPFVKPINDFGIVGPEALCLYYGSIIGEFFGGGLATDVFKWKIIKSDGSLLVEREGGFQSFSHTFSEEGTFEIQLTVRRGVEEVFSGTKQIIINPGADLAIQNSYLLCEDGTATLSLLSPSVPNIGAYQIKWIDSSGHTVGNSNSIVVNRPDRYTVEFFTLNEVGIQVCPFSITTYVYKPKEYNLAISSPQVCDGGTLITVTAGNSVFGNWYYKKNGVGEKKFLGMGNKWEIISTRDLAGIGDYEIIFEVDNSGNNFCKLSDSINLKVNQTADLSINFENPVTDCGSSDGVLVVVAVTDMDLLRVRRNGIQIARFENVEQGQVFRLEGLNPGLYTASAALGGCSRTRATIIPLANPPLDLLYTMQEVVGETCEISGKINGKIKIKMEDPNFIGSFRLLNTSGGVVKSGTVDTPQSFTINAPAGNYFLELNNDEGCIYPRPQRITISSKGQVTYSAPDRLTVCEYFDFTPTTNQNLKFTLIYPDNSTVTKPKGESFRLDQSGEYSLLGFESDSQGGFCPRETNIFVSVTNQTQFEPELISRDCFGNKKYKANLFGEDPSRFHIKWINEKNVVVGTEEFLFPISYGEFKLDVQPKNSESCPAPPKSFFIEEPVLSVDINLTATVLCPESSSSISLDTDFDKVNTIFWLFIDLSGNTMVLDEFENKKQITVENPGTYEAIAFNDLNCEIGRDFVTLSLSTIKASFEIPEQLIVCDFHELIPTTDLELVFTLVSPNGEIRVFETGQSILFSQSGEYLLTAQSADPAVAMCPVSKKIEVVKNLPLNFEPKLVEQTCEGKLVFEAYLFGRAISEADIFWYNEEGELVGSEQFLSPQSYGSFSLEVRPKGSFPCPAPKSKEFEVIKPIVELEGNLTSTPFCSEGENVTVSLDTDFNLVSKINWFFRDFNGNSVWLRTFSDQKEIVTTKEGTYEVEVFNDRGCLLGRDVIMVMRSMDQSRPEVEDSYTLCPALGMDEGINPGDFQKYSWTLNGKTVSNESVFSPSKSGPYTITVTNFDGCTYSASFEVIVECEVQVTHTTGMSTKDIQRPFKVYSNPLVDEVGVWIYNKWGQLVYQSTPQNQTSGNVACEWYGDFNGQPIEIGTYAVKIIYKNSIENITKTIWSSVTVVD